MKQETEHFVLFEPETYYRTDTPEGRQAFLEWIEQCYARSHEYIEMLPGGFALFRKTHKSEPPSDDYTPLFPLLALGAALRTVVKYGFTININNSTHEVEVFESAVGPILASADDPSINLEELVVRAISEAAARRDAKIESHANARIADTHGSHDD